MYHESSRAQCHAPRALHGCSWPSGNFGRRGDKREQQLVFRNDATWWNQWNPRSKTLSKLKGCEGIEGLLPGPGVFVRVLHAQRSLFSMGRTTSWWNFERQGAQGRTEGSRLEVGYVLVAVWAGVSCVRAKSWAVELTLLHSQAGYVEINGLHDAGDTKDLQCSAKPEYMRGAMEGLSWR